MGGYDPKGREIIADFARVMRHLGTSFGVLRKEKCTGDPVRRLGNDLLFQQLAESNLKTLAQNNVKKIVTICPIACAPFRKTGRSTAHRLRLSTTASSWRVLPTNCLIESRKSFRCEWRKSFR